MTESLANKGFDWKFYVNYYEDLKEAGINSEKKAIDHYLKFGRMEDRVINAELVTDLVDIVQKPQVSVTKQFLNNMTNQKNRSFNEIGQQFCDFFATLIKLKANQNILDLGCGNGIITLPLTKYLNSAGSYSGCDMDRNNIELCRSRISSNYSNFTFQHISLTKGASSKVVLPYDDGSFDFVYATAIFTHTTPDITKQYLNEISRVLKNNGKCLLIYFLWNPFIDTLTKEGKTSLINIQNHDEYKTINNNLKEQAISFMESSVIDWHNNAKLPISQIIYGHWSGQITGGLYQDVVFAEKKLRSVKNDLPISDY